MGLLDTLFGGQSYAQQMDEYDQMTKDQEELEGLQHRRSVNTALSPHFDAMRAQQSPEQSVYTSAIQEMLRHQGTNEQGIKSLGDLYKQGTNLRMGIVPCL